VLELQVEMGGGSIKCAVLAPLLSFIIIAVNKALAELVYWHLVQARFIVKIDVTVVEGFYKGSPSTDATRLSANFKTQIDRVECFTEVVW